MSHFDIIIVGSGIVGATTALLLAKNPTLNIAILDAQSISSQWNSRQYDHRVSAIARSSKKIFQQLDLWSTLKAKRISSYTHMQVWDEAGTGRIDFDCREVNLPALGYIVEDSVMRTSLIEKVSQTPTIQLIHPVKLMSLQQKSDRVELTTKDQQIYSATLLIGADGANSWVREQIQTELTSWDYEQTAIVATVQTELPHQATAWQRFLSTGPLAFLPLSDPHQCSIVWSATHADANELIALSDEDFCQRLSTAFEKKLGAILQTTKRFHFPLRMRHVKNYVQDKVVLIGDAAHTLHPLAGQGVNLGLLDAASLADVILADVEKQRDFSRRMTLRRFERARKADNAVMMTTVNFLKSLFISENQFVQQTRNLGLSFTNQLPIIKQMLTHYATSVTPEKAGIYSE